LRGSAPRERHDFDNLIYILKHKAAKNHTLKMNAAKKQTWIDARGNRARADHRLTGAVQARRVLNAP